MWQYLLIQFLPAAFSQYANVEWMWPGVPMSLFGASFTFNVLGYSVRVGVAGSLGVPDFLYNILTTVLTGGVSMVIFFVINKLIFPEGDAKNRAVRLDGGAQTLSPQNKRSPWQEPEGPVTQIISIKAAMRVVSWPTSALE